MQLTLRLSGIAENSPFVLPRHDLRSNRLLGKAFHAGPLHLRLVRYDRRCFTNGQTPEGIRQSVAKRDRLHLAFYYQSLLDSGDVSSRAQIARHLGGARHVCPKS